MNKNYVIGSGWWCTDQDERLLNTSRKFIGSDVIRGERFHQIWYDSICRNTNPKKILIVDSNSPIRPNLNKDDDRLEFISLPMNAGHSTKHSGRWSGWTRSVILGLEYALMSDSDYYVYVEQDVLLHGKGIIEHCIARMTRPFMFGPGTGTPQPLQQSFFLIEREGMNPFLQRLKAIKSLDSELSPEEKFAISTSRALTTLCPILGHAPSRIRRKFFNRLSSYDELPIGYGRTRPLDLTDEFFYFQHGTDAELDQYMMKG